MTQNVVNLRLRMTEEEAKKILLDIYKKKGEVIVEDTSYINPSYVMGSGNEFVEIDNLGHNILVAAISEDQ